MKATASLATARGVFMNQYFLSSSKKRSYPQGATLRIIGISLTLFFTGVSVSFAFDFKSSRPDYVWDYKGCYVDKEDRDINGRLEVSLQMTPQGCQAYCERVGYRVAAVQHGEVCFCGDDYGKYGAVPDTECNMACKGDIRNICGAAWRNRVFRRR